MIPGKARKPTVNRDANHPHSVIASDYEVVHMSGSGIDVASSW